MQTTLPFRLPDMRAFPARGFTLVELMIALALGLLTTLVITQVVVLTDSKKRTLTMGTDAQVNGSLSLYTIQREIQMSGYGAINDPGAMGCPIKGEYKEPGVPEETPGVAFNPVLAPVVITDGANGMPDTLTIMQGRKSSFSAPMLVMSPHLKTNDFFIVKSSFGAAAGDLMIVVPADNAWSSTNWCTVFSVTDDGAAAPGTDTTLGPKRVPHTSGTSAWNHSELFPDRYEKNSYLLNLGTMAHNTYSVDGAFNLIAMSRTAGAAASASTALYPQIVNLQAMYGKDTTLDGQVDTYDTTTPANALEWQQVLSIRLAVVARSGQYEKDEVTQSAPLWDVGAGSAIAGTENCGTSKCLRIKIDHVPEWKHYRYKVYDTIVPLRNVLWNSATAAP
ncbi:PilW family protein [Variovorax sp. OV329]|uniref:PilW family protein n=1 Tax=Variovorax sp. OV329 TaxID=1882825 RepID=UPI0008F27C01|nr:PilW family protein [Variovorax sp. OV329]SFM31741.1 type IV pilus assembly protein PilW [Variovorax sp. OV329]